MNIIFMGTPDFAVPALKKLIERHNVVVVVTQPDRHKGRGNKILFSPIKETASHYNIPVLQPLKIRAEQVIAELKEFNADLFVVVAYGQILPEAILNMPPLGCINVHGSLLPKYRGAAPIQYSIINGETKTGVTIMYMDKGIDTGDMILKREIPIEPEDTYGTLHDKMSVTGAELLLDAITQIESGKAVREKQNDCEATYAHMISKELEKIDWMKNPDSTVNLIRGLNPSPGAYTETPDGILKIWSAFEIDGYEKGRHGEIIDIVKNRGFVVKAGNGALLITEVQPQGKKRMSAPDYLRGRVMEFGTLLY